MAFQKGHKSLRTKESYQMAGIKISKSRKGIVFSQETRHKMSLNKLGKPRAGNPENWKHTQETKDKIGVLSSQMWANSEIKARLKENHYMHGKIDEKHHNWKGNNVAYEGLHRWVERHLGKPARCEFCGGMNRKRYDWANRTGQYLRDLTDWLRLCIPCHRRYDYSGQTEALFIK